MEVLIGIVFVVIISFIVVIMVKFIRQWRYNNAQPRLSVVAKITSKRLDVSSHMSGNDNNGFSNSRTNTYYYVTFEVESGDRMELEVDGFEYGSMAEDDTGKLSFQGTRFLGFSRDVGQALT